MSYKIILVFSLFLSASLSWAQGAGGEASFAVLNDCWTGFSNDEHTTLTKASDTGFKRDMHVISVQHFSDKSANTSRTTVGRDSFLILNATGAELVTPERKSTNRAIQNNYDYDFYAVVPGESGQGHISYHTSTPRVSVPMWIESTPTSHAKPPELNVTFEEARELMRKVIVEKTAYDKENAGAAGDSLKSNAITLFRYNAGSKSTLALAKEQTEKSIQLLEECKKLNDPAIAAAAEEKAGILRSHLVSLDTPPRATAVPPPVATKVERATPTATKRSRGAK